jgi:hypothetical protein
MGKKRPPEGRPRRKKVEEDSALVLTIAKNSRTTRTRTDVVILLMDVRAEDERLRTMG